jgi:hypothetical protein
MTTGHSAFADVKIGGQQETVVSTKCFEIIP